MPKRLEAARTWDHATFFTFPVIAFIEMSRQHSITTLIFAHSSLKSLFPPSTAFASGSDPGGNIMDDDDDKRFRRRDLRGAPLRHRVLDASMVLEAESTFRILCNNCGVTKVSMYSIICLVSNIYRMYKYVCSCTWKSVRIDFMGKIMARRDDTNTDCICNSHCQGI